MPLQCLCSASARQQQQERRQHQQERSGAGRKHSEHGDDADAIDNPLGRILWGQDVWATVRFGGIVYIGNVAGALLVGGLLDGADIFHGQQDAATRLEDIVTSKTDYEGASTLRPIWATSRSLM